MTEAEIDEFMDHALAELEEIRIDAKKALVAVALSCLLKVRLGPLWLLFVAVARDVGMGHLLT